MKIIGETFENRLKNVKLLNISRKWPRHQICWNCIINENLENKPKACRNICNKNGKKIHVSCLAKCTKSIHRLSALITFSLSFSPSFSSGNYNETNLFLSWYSSFWQNVIWFEREYHTNQKSWCNAKLVSSPWSCTETTLSCPMRIDKKNLKLLLYTVKWHNKLDFILVINKMAIKQNAHADTHWQSSTKWNNEQHIYAAVIPSHPFHGESCENEKLLLPLPERFATCS